MVGRVREVCDVVENPGTVGDVVKRPRTHIPFQNGRNWVVLCTHVRGRRR